MENINFINKSGVIGFGTEAKKLKVKEADFKNIIYCFTKYAKEDTPTNSETILSTETVMPEQTIEPIKDKVYSFETEPEPIREEIEKPRTTYSFEEPAKDKEIASIVNANSGPRIESIAAKIMDMSKKITDPKTDYEITIVNGAKKLEKLYTTLNSCKDKTTSIKEEIDKFKSGITAKKSDVAMTEKNIKDNIPNPSFDNISERGRWQGDYIPSISDIYERFKSGYQALVSIIEQMKEEVSQDEKEVVKKEALLKDLEDDKKKIEEAIKELTLEIEKALKIASDADKLNDQTKKYKEETEARIEEGEIKIAKLRGENPFLNEKTATFEEAKSIVDMWKEERTFNPFEGLREENENSYRRAA